jgi:hypothetical protein
VSIPEGLGSFTTALYSVRMILFFEKHCIDNEMEQPRP